MLYLKTTRKEKEKRKKILCRKARVKLTYIKGYKTLQNIVQKREGQGLQYLYDLAASAAE